mgnify:CR=1 FL=1
MKRGLGLLLAAFGVTLAVVVGVRLEAAGLAVVVGILCGIVAALPVNGALLYMLWRERRERERLEERLRLAQERPPATAPVVILNAGRAVDMLPGGGEMLGAYGLAGRQGAREFTIVGEEESAPR